MSKTDEEKHARVNVAPTRHRSCLAADLRMHQYLHWLERRMHVFPQGVIDEADHQFAVRMLSVLDCVCLLLSDQDLNRLLRLLEHLDQNGPLVPRDAAVRLMELGERDFFWFVTRQVAATADDGDRSAEEMVTSWHRGFCFQAQPGQPTGVLFSDGAFSRYQKPYRGLLIDRDLDEGQMDRLNAVPEIEIKSTCAGHPELSSPPAFSYMTADGEPFDVECDLANTGRNHAELRQWWEEAITRLERLDRSPFVDAHPGGRLRISDRVVNGSLLSLK